MWPAIDRNVAGHSPARSAALSAATDGWLRTRSWSWGESNPRPPGGHRTCYDHSRLLSSQQLNRRVGRPRRAHCRVFPRRQRSFTPSAVSPCGPPPLLLPGCGGPAPCAIAGHDFPLRHLKDQAARANCSLSAVLCVSLFNESETTRVARSTSRSQRRNQSAPCVSVIVPVRADTGRPGSGGSDPVPPRHAHRPVTDVVTGRRVARCWGASATGSSCRSG